jgi:hypothetical protein
MKKYQQLITLGVLLCSFNSSAYTFNSSAYTFLDLAKREPICPADQLTPEEARSRVEWAYKCGHISYYERNNNLYEYDYERHESVKRPLPSYPVYSSGGRWNPDLVVTTPTSKWASCSILSDYSLKITATCYSVD